MKTPILLRSLLAAALTLSATLHAGTVLTGVQTQSNGGAMTSTIALDAGRARMESDAQGRKMVMIYRADKDLFWIVDTESKTYREMTREDMAAMAAQVSKAMEQMQEQMKNLPPEQRAMVEKMMGGKMAAGKKAAPTVEYRKEGPGGKVGEWTTQKYIATTDGKKTSELWVAPSSAVKIGDAELKTMEQMLGFFKEIAGKFGADAMTSFGPDPRLDGMPVKVVSFSDGQPIGTYVVKSVEHRDLPASMFEVPQGFEKQEMAMPKM